MSRPIHSGSMLSLAIMAMLALVVPVIWAANSSNSVRNISAKAPVMTPNPTPRVYPSGEMPAGY